MRVFIIHGWTYSLDKWEPLKKELKDLSIEPTFLKVPGLTEPSNKSWTMDEYVEWLHSKLKGQGAPIIVGHSNGGRIAINYLMKYPGGFGKLILIASAGIPHRQAGRKLKLSTLKAIAKIGKPLKYVPGVRKIFYRLVGGLDYYQAPPNMRVTMKNMLAANQNIELSKINVPVTIIWGRQDMITPLSDGRLIHQGIKGSMIHIIEDADHRPYFTHPQRVARLIKDAINAK